ncbi:MAG: 50S ribosomal protein L23 [Planctomycetota bacterium]
MLESVFIIRKPVVTEKSTFHSSEFGRYTFEVNRSATKPEIKKAVEELYGVRVLSVATQNRRGRLRRNKFGHWRADRKKHATVKLHPEDRIDLI